MKNKELFTTTVDWVINILVAPFVMRWSEAKDHLREFLQTINPNNFSIGTFYGLIKGVNYLTPKN